jgi:hypothetical protein
MEVFEDAYGACMIFDDLRSLEDSLAVEMKEDKLDTS